MSPKHLFEILVRENADMLTVYLRCAIHDSSAVDDLFQETMLTAWRTLDRFDRSRPFGPWLRGIAAKLVLAHHRKSARRHLLCNEDILEHLGSRQDGVQRLPGDTLEDKLDTLRECIGALPDRYREAVRLRYHDELRGRKLAEELDISHEALKKRLQRARARLFDCLRRKLTVQGVIP